MKTLFKKHNTNLMPIAFLSAILWFSTSLPAHSQPSKEEGDQKSDCEAHVQRLESIQDNIYKFKVDPNGSDYISLLKERDGLMAKKAFIESMIKVWDEYNSYLDESHQFQKDYGAFDLKLTKKLEGLSTLKDVISGNREAVQRYNLMASVFGDIDVTKINGEDRQQRFDQMRALLKEQCTGENAQANKDRMYCKAVGSNDTSWDSMKYGEAPSDTGSSQRDMIHKFMEVSVTAFGAEFMGVFKNMSTMFVDNQDFNGDLVNDIDYANGVDFGTSVGKAIDETIAFCRRQALAASEGDVDCLERDMSQVMAESGQQRYFEKIQSTLGDDVKSPTDLLSRFLENAETLQKAHEEVTGGVISDFAKLVENKDQYLADLDSFGEEAEGLRADAQEHFNKRAAVHLANLGDNLKQLSNNQRAYESTKPEECKGMASPMICGALEELSSVISSDKQDTLAGLFKNSLGPSGEAGDMKLVANDPVKLLNFLMDNNLDKDNLTAILKGNDGRNNSLEAKLNAVERKIAAFKENETYKTLEDIKAFVWKRAENECAAVSKVTNNTSCKASDSFSEVDRLFEFGGKVAAYQSNEREKYNLADIEKKCDTVRQNNQTSTFDFDIIGICNEVSKSYSNLVAYQNYYSEEEVYKRLRTRKTYDSSGNVTGSYTEKSFTALFLPALARQSVTVMPTWANKYNVKSYALQQTILGKRQKDYNAYIDMLQSSAAASCSGLFGCSSLWSYQSYYPSYSSYSSFSGLSSLSSSSTSLFSN